MNIKTKYISGNNFIPYPPFKWNVNVWLMYTYISDFVFPTSPEIDNKLFILGTYFFRIQLRRCVLDTTLCDKACQWLAAVRWFSPVSSTNKTNPYDITEILLKVVLNTITLTLQSFSIPSYHWVTFKTFEIIISLSNLLTMSASDEGYSRKASVVHRMIFDFSVFITLTEWISLLADYKSPEIIIRPLVIVSALPWFIRYTVKSAHKVTSIKQSPV